MKYSAYPAYKDSDVEWLGEIPEHWEVMQLKRCLKSYDYGLSDNIRGEGIFKVLTMGHIQDGKVLIPEEGSIENAPKELVLEYGDLLFNRTNSRELVGKVGIFQGNLEDKVTFASYLVRLRTKNYAKPTYLNFLLNSQLILSKVRQDALLSINQANLNPTKYGQIRIPLPPIEEQQAIASFLNRETAKIDALIAKKERLIELLQEKRTAIISHAVTKGLEPTVQMKDSGVEWLGAIPAHWEVMPLKRSLKSSDYGLSDNIKGEGIFKVLTMGHIQDGKVLIPEEGSLDNVPKELVLEYDDLLFNRTNSRELVGKVGIFKGNSKDKVTFASYLVRLKANDYAEPNYLNFLLNSQLILSKVRQDALLSINQANLNPTKYCQIRIPLPPIDEQAAIASYLDRETTKIDALIAKIREGIEKLKEYRTALISAAVTGKISVQ